MELRERVRRLPWFHEIDLGEIITPGKNKLEILRAQAEIYFKDGVKGKTVLDIGCWDGFNSFEAKRRGASRVLATDYYVWSGQSWGSRESFELAREALGLDVEMMQIDLPNITPDSVGTFDIVLFCGVLYHLRNPFWGLEQAAKVCRGTLVVETYLETTADERPAMVFYPTTELNGDPTNWWGPNRQCVIEMLRDLQFSVEFVGHPTCADRGIFLGRRALPGGRTN